MKIYVNKKPNHIFAQTVPKLVKPGVREQTYTFEKEMGYDTPLQAKLGICNNYLNLEGNRDHPFVKHAH